MTTMVTPATAGGFRAAGVAALRQRLRGAALLPGEMGYDEARAAWNRNARQEPAVIVVAEDAEDVRAAVRFARDEDLGVGVMATGHGVGTPCDGGVLINTARMREVRIDPVGQTAKVGAGTLWTEVIAAAAPHGLAGLAGSAPHVGVVGYTMGGGFGWLGRKFGLNADGVTAAEIVTADGEIVRLSATENPDLFWGLKGGGGNVGIVTSLEFRLYPLTTVYGGAVFYPVDAAPAVLERYAGWSAALPDEVTSAFVFLNLPPLPAVPQPLQGRPVIAVRACYCGQPPAHGEAMFRPIREGLGAPLMDTFGELPVAAMASISKDPVDPVGILQRADLLTDLSSEAIAALIGVAGAGSGSPLTIVELRQLGGALARSPERLSPIGSGSARYSLNAIGLTLTPEMALSVSAQMDRLIAAMRPFRTGETCLNYLELDPTTDRIRAAYPAADWDRLVALKATYDPENRFRFNRNIPPARGGIDTLRPGIGTARKERYGMKQVLVTGATGNAGSGVVRDLQERGLAVRAFVRDAGKAAAMFGGGVEIVTGDFGDAASVERAMAGVDGVFLACANDPRQVAFETGVIDAARKAGVKRLVKLSAHGAEIGSPVAFWDWHGRIEAHLKASGIPAVVLRPTFNMTNLFGSAESIQHAGSLFVPAEGARVAMIDPADIAAVAAVTLTEETHDGRIYTLTGPESITFAQVAADLAAVAGKPVQFIPVPDEAARQGLIAAGMPDFVADQIVAIFAYLRRGDQDRTSAIVRNLTGREARGLGQFLRDHAGFFQARAA